MDDRNTRHRLHPWLGWSLAILVMIPFACLGNWQLGRAKQKQAMLDEVRQVLKERRPEALSVAADPARARAYDWSAGSGHFVQSAPVLLDNQLREGRAGVRAYRLFQPAHGAPLLVELGWLPLPADRSLPQIALPAGEFALQGLLLPPPSGGIAGSVVTRQANGALLTVGMDADSLAQPLGVGKLPPRVLRPDPALFLGYQRDMEVLPNTLPPEKHLGYAVQWFGLALAVLVTALVLTVRQGRRGREKMQA